MGSEGSPRQSSDPRNTNRIRGRGTRVSPRDRAKPVAIKGFPSKCGGCGVEAVTLTRGGLQICPVRTMDFSRNSEGSAEVSRGHSRTADQSEGPNM